MIPHFAVGVTLAFCAVFTSSADGAEVNLTIDDSNSTYFTFAGSWHAVTPATPCVGCFDSPDVSQIVNSTWHDGSRGSGSFTFQGVLCPLNQVTFCLLSPGV
jgi:hypothetical protein